ncbi:cytochrome c oxidase assembly protein [Brevundimonas sp.]|jgi:putative membrane protein|uniref:cytochrome c oxidase assembly protein n=1 Tax=Brevundimonas sp. TaxID=1871086 RepID=UPI0037C04904
MSAAPVWTPYCGPAPDAGDWRWNLDPVLLALLVLATGLIVWRLQGRRRAFGLAAMAVLALGFVSPLCALSSALFAARTVHHVLLVAVAAPLLAAILPERRAGSLLLATAVQAAVFWAWHAPGAYAAALSNDGLYWIMQSSLVASAVWFWAAARAASAPTAVVALLAAMLAMGLLGAVLTFAGQAVYAPHAYTTLAWGLTPLEDQQAAGLIMWAPAAALYLVAALWRLGRMLGPDVEARPA